MSGSSQSDATQLIDVLATKELGVTVFGFLHLFALSALHPVSTNFHSLLSYAERMLYGKKIEENHMVDTKLMALIKLEVPKDDNNDEQNCRGAWEFSRALRQWDAYESLMRRRMPYNINYARTDAIYDDVYPVYIEWMRYSTGYGVLLSKLYQVKSLFIFQCSI